MAIKDLPATLKVLKNDAERGIPEAQNYLGMFYDTKSNSNVLAHMWYNLSGLQGHMDATRQIQSIEKKMSQAQIEQAQTMAANWKPKQ